MTKSKIILVTLSAMIGLFILFDWIQKKEEKPTVIHTSYTNFLKSNKYDFIIRKVYSRDGIRENDQIFICNKEEGKCLKCFYTD